jgi:hypothetical protein
MAQYTYSVSVDFPHGLKLDQLVGEIIAAIPTPAFLDASRNEDVIIFSFASTLPDVAILNAVIAAHVPVYYNFIAPYLKNDVVTNKIGTSELAYFGNNKLEIIISKNSQSHYNSIKEAIAQNNVVNQIFTIYPGTYVEDNPLVLPEGASLVAIGSAANTTIVAQNPDKDLITLNQKCKLYGLTFYGAYYPGSRGIYFDGSQSGGAGLFSVIGECYVIDCDIAVECDGKNIAGVSDTLFCDKLVMGTKYLATTKGVHCHSGGQFITTTCYSYGSPSYPMARGYSCIDQNSKISLSNASAWFCGTSLFIDNNGEAEISLLNLKYNNIGAIVGPNGLTSRLSATSLIFRDSITYDVDIQATTANVEIYSSFLDDAKLHNPNDVNITVRYNANKFGSYYQTIIGDMQIGSPFQPSKFAAGEGLFVNSNISILSNSSLESGTWLDNTAVALVSNGSPFSMFQTISAGNCMYFGSSKYIFGFKVNVTTATTSIIPQTDAIWEYWNGTTWVQFKVLQTYPDTRQAYINSFLGLQSKFHIRFGLTKDTPFALKTLNGTSKNWVRLRVVNDLPSLPYGDYVKIHTSATVINSDGFLEFFGVGRTFKNKELITYPDVSLSLPSSQELFFAPGLTSSKLYNIFANSALTRVGFSFKMPIEIDISFPIKINIGFVCDDPTEGNIEWILKYTYSNTNTNVYLNNIDAQTNPNPNTITITKITQILSNTNKTNLNEVIVIDCSTISSNPSTNDKYHFYGTLTRDATTKVTDTYTGNVTLIGVDYDYVIWSSGGHLLSF